MERLVPLPLFRVHADAYSLAQVGGQTIVSVCNRGFGCPYARRLHPWVERRGVLAIPTQGNCCWEVSSKQEQLPDGKLRHCVLQQWGWAIAGEQWQQCRSRVKWGDLRKADALLMRLEQQIQNIGVAEAFQTGMVHSFGHSNQVHNLFYTGTESTLVSNREALKLCRLFGEVIGQAFPFGPVAEQSQGGAKPVLALSLEMGLLGQTEEVTAVLLGAISSALQCPLEQASFKSTLQQTALTQLLVGCSHLFLKLPCGE